MTKTTHITSSSALPPMQNSGQDGHITEEKMTLNTVIEQHNPVAERRQKLRRPSMAQLERWDREGGCEAACSHGCWVEPDGTCEHGRRSWLLVLGMI